MILKTEPAIGQSSVIGDKLLSGVSGYACTFATYVQKIKAAMGIECEEKIRIDTNTDPVEKKPESGHDSQAALITREKNHTRNYIYRPA